MLAFHNDQAIKDKYLDRLRIHAAHDEIIKGKYWENGKGCAVGCTIHGSNHSTYETELGIPKTLAHLEDRIFENLPNELAKTWPIRFLEAIPVGKDLSLIWPKFAIYLLTDKEQCASIHPQCDIVAQAYQDQLDRKSVSWFSVTSAAAASAANASVYADYADYAAAASAAASASGAYAADYALAAAAAASAAASAANDAYSQSYIKQSEKLLQLLGEEDGNPTT